MREFDYPEEEIKKVGESYIRSVTPTRERRNNVPTVIRLQEIASRIKGKDTPRSHSNTKSISGGGADDDEYKSCNEDNY